MSYAISKGLYHPRCKDRHTTYFPGISTADDTWTKKDLEDIGIQAKQEARQQYAERQEKRFCRLVDFYLDEENWKKYELKEKEQKSVAKQNYSGILKKNKGILKMDLQVFAEKDIKSQDSNSLKRSIRKFQKRINEHEDYIANPGNHCSDWDSKLQCEKDGLMRHWKKEIRNFNQSIQDRVDELKERGDYDD